MVTANQPVRASRPRKPVTSIVVAAYSSVDPLKPTILPPGLGQTRGSEHEVWLSPDGTRVIKATHPGEFGRKFGATPFATLPEYLERIRLTVDEFGLDWKVLGSHGSGKNMRVVTSQPAFSGTPPSMSAIHSFLQGRGFKFYRTRFGDAWYRAEARLLISDAEPKNAIETRDGIVPFDFIVCKPLPEILTLAGIS
jgi:hypothetical protein